MIEARARARLGQFALDAEFRADSDTVVVVGHNGSGKSTLLRCLARLLRCEAELRVDGRSLGERDVIYVPPRPALPRGLTVREAVELIADMADAEPMVEELGVSGLMRRRVEELSSGEAQRAMLAAVMRSGKLLLLDEPLAYLDPEWRGVVTRALMRRGRAIVATHDAELVVAGGYVVVLRSGRVAYSGPVSGLEVIVAEPCGEGVCTSRRRVGEAPVALGPAV